MQETFFNVFMEHSEQDTERPLFIRDELISSCFPNHNPTILAGWPGLALPEKNASLSY